MHLVVHSYFSLRYGILPLEALIDLAIQKGHHTLALTDINNTSGSLEFVQMAQKKGVRPIIGIEFRTDKKPYYVGLARSAEGFHALNGFLSACVEEAARGKTNQRKGGIDKRRMAMIREAAHKPTAYDEDDEDMIGPGSVLPTAMRDLRFPERAPDLPDVTFIYPFASAPPADALGEHEYIGLTPVELHHLSISPFFHHQHKLVCFLPVTFRDKQDYRLHTYLRAIDGNKLLSQVEKDELAAADEYMLTPNAFDQLYAAYPLLSDTTRRVMAECRFEMDFTTSKNKAYYTTSKEDDLVLLRKLAREGCIKRYGRDNQKARKRVESELKVIAKMDFCSYFLICLDIITYSKSQGYAHVGRGSGANSVVVYCLGISEVDPIEYDLPFERFLNPERTSPPDLDNDWDWTLRPYIEDYIFKRYGTRYTAYVATYVFFKYRSAVRELGKVFGLPRHEIDHLVRSGNRPEKIEGIGRAILAAAARLEDIPNHLGMHPGGILISERPIHCYSATSLPPKGLPTVHFDMHTAEKVGLHKLDILSQRGLGHVRTAIELAWENKGARVDVTDWNHVVNDPAIAKILEVGDTKGVFFAESDSIEGSIKRTRCNNYRSLAIVASIIRPGVASSGMMSMYEDRELMAKGLIPMTEDPDSWFLHPSMKEYLEEDHGVIIYQESVLNVLHHFAGFTFGESDVFRRIMCGKSRGVGTLEMVKEKFISNCRAQGHAENVIHEVLRQLLSFVGFTFSKAHALAYARLSFQSLYLKAHFPLEHMVAVINNFGGFYSTEFYFHEARMKGGIVHAPCVNRSAVLTSIKGSDIHVGLIHMKGLEQEVADAIVAGRSQGDYSSFEDLVRRVPALGREQARLLVRIGALRFTGKSKMTLLWELGMRYSKAREQYAPTLFPVRESTWDIPDFPSNPLEDAWDELEILGFPLQSPFLMAAGGPYKGEVPARSLPEREGQVVVLRGYLISTKPVLTVHGDRMGFVNFIDAAGERFNAVMFPATYSRYSVSETGVYVMQGLVTVKHGVATVTIQKIQLVPRKPDPRHEEDSPALSRGQK